MAVNRLKAPRNLRIDFSPSPRQYELWKLLQPNCCPHCGGEIEQVLAGYDPQRNPQYRPRCVKCHSQNLPQLILGGGAAGGGKAAPLDSTICTPFGFRKVRDLKVGDIISSATTGGQQRVIWLHPVEEHDYYRIHFIDGTYFDCSSGHLWQLHQSRKRTKRKDADGNRNDWRIWSTRMIYDWMQRKKHGMYAGCNLIIPLCAPVQFTSGKRYRHPKTIEPYILGAILGDGCVTKSVTAVGSVQFTTMDDEIVRRFVSAGYNMDHFREKSGNRAKSYLIYDRSFVEALRELGLEGCTSAEKFIPRQYKYATIEERKQLVQGLMDTDGYVDERGHMSYSTTSGRLAEDVAFVIRSLGGIATIKRNPAGYRDREGGFIRCKDSYDVYFRTRMNPELVGLSSGKYKVD